MNSNLLREYNLMSNLCFWLNKDFGCRKAFDCEIACPLMIAHEVQKLLPLKGATPGDLRLAYKQIMRKGIKQAKAVKIIEGIFGIDIEEIREALMMEDEYV